MNAPTSRRPLNWILGLSLAMLFAVYSNAQENTGAKNVVADFIWLTTQPAGATVEYKGRKVGKTPTMIQKLPEGQHTLRLTRKAYTPLEVVCDVPNAGDQFVFTLPQAKGSCVITSTPENATVLIGPKVYGRTPIYLDPGELQAGDYLGAMMKIGYQTERLNLRINADRANAYHMDLQKAVGNLKLTITPADATIYVDGHKHGTGKAGENTIRSEPRVFSGLLAGRHELRIEYGGEPGPEVNFVVKPDATVEANLLMWFPTLEVKTKDDREMHAMVIETRANGDIVAAISPTEIRTIAAEQIKYQNPIPHDEAKRLVQKERRQRKMREQLERMRRQKGAE